MGFSFCICFISLCSCSAVRIKFCAIRAGVKNYKSIIKEKEEAYYTVEVIISKILITSYINHDKFVSVNNILREYYETKEKIKHPETSVENII